jgi:hypothetical protein
MKKIILCLFCIICINGIAFSKERPRYSNNVNENIINLQWKLIKTKIRSDKILYMLKKDNWTLVCVLRIKKNYSTSDCEIP